MEIKIRIVFFSFYVEWYDVCSNKFIQIGYGEA